MFRLLYKHRTIFILFLAFCLFFLFSCTKDIGIKEIPSVVVSDSCDTITYKYHLDVQTIISDHCVKCHGASSSNGILIYYSHVNAYALNGSLVRSLKGQGYPLMPPTGKLSDCEIKGIENWVKAGAANN